MSKQYKESFFIKAGHVFKVLARPNVLKTLKLLAGNELCVTDVEKVMPFAPSTASRALVDLFKTGLVTREKRGAKVFYKVKPSYRVFCLYLCNPEI